MVSIRKLCTRKGGVVSTRPPAVSSSQTPATRQSGSPCARIPRQAAVAAVGGRGRRPFAKRVNERGEFPGVVRAAPPWNWSPHTLYSAAKLPSARLEAAHAPHRSSATPWKSSSMPRAPKDKLPPTPPPGSQTVLQQHARRWQANLCLRRRAARRRIGLSTRRDDGASTSAAAHANGQNLVTQ